ncbi:hypothetical protein D3C83_39930 [compost metagenome]
MQLAQVLVAQAPFLERAGAEILDHDVELGNQALQQLARLGLAEVERGDALVAQDARGIERFPVHGGVELAHRVAFGGLDLHYLGAEVGEQPRAEGAGHGRAELQHAVIRERSTRHVREV